jgi:hypothetical protein
MITVAVITLSGFLGVHKNWYLFDACWSLSVNNSFVDITGKYEIVLGGV